MNPRIRQAALQHLNTIAQDGLPWIDRAEIKQALENPEWELDGINVDGYFDFEALINVVLNAAQENQAPSLGTESV